MCGIATTGADAEVLIIAIDIQVAAGPCVPTVESIATPVAITHIGKGTAIAIAATIVIAAETGVAVSIPPVTAS
jgi:NaMN:DMB phosphoribosyltransferase